MMNTFLKSFTYAFNGVKYCFKNEFNFKVQLIFAVLVIVLGSIFSISKIEWVIVFICIGLVLSAELFNTAIETICNKIEQNYNSTIKIIKDTSAAAVLVLSIVSAVIGLLIFIPKII